jgi:hypothetical protein
MDIKNLIFTDLDSSGSAWQHDSCRVSDASAAHL